MRIKSLQNLLFLAISMALIGCSNSGRTDEATKEKSIEQDYPNVQVSGAMRNVMWKGKLGATIALDTIKQKEGLYAIGPMEYLRGELLINDGRSYLSTVVSDSTMKVEQTYQVAAPFLVYANVHRWKELELPTDVKSIIDLEQFIDQQTTPFKRPFVFKLKGTINKGIIHIQNLAPGSKVSSPEEAHQGQVKYPLGEEEVEIVGFFSTEHHGVFTHHDSNVHLHLITTDESQMGHLDEVEFERMTLFLPVD